jgi:tetratricopeptide (TPR) repeat protein
MKRFIIAMCMSLMAFVASAQTSIQVQVHDVVTLDEQFTVSFVVEGNRPAEFEWESGDDFELLWGPQQGRSSSVQIINGKKTESSQTTYSYILRPVKTGKFTLPKARAVVDGKEIFSKTVSVEVLGGGSSDAQHSSSQGTSSRNSRADAAGQDIFLVLSLDKTNVVVGEPIKAVLKLYQKTNIAGFEGADFPDFDGFWSQETLAPSNIQFARESYNNQIYNAAVLREYALVPQHSGTIEIGPAELVCLVNVRVSSGGTSLFDGFFDEYTTMRKKVASKPVSVKVKPLPAGAPASFAGGVGVFSVKASLTRDTLAAHEAASLVLNVSGRGNVSLLETPKITFPLDVESYDPKVSGNVAANGLAGTKTYEYPFIPRSAGDFEIGPILYTYYDVDQHRYITLDAGTLTMTVERGNEYDDSPARVSGYVGQKVANKGADIRYISVKTPDFTLKGGFLLGSGLFWILTSAILFVALLLWIILKNVASRRADVVGMKHRKANKMALKRLRIAGDLLKQNKYSEFYAELHNALLGYVSDKLNMPIAELSKDRMSEALLNNGAQESYVTELMAVLDSCEYARYAPSTGNQAMTSDYEKALEVISSIDSCMKTRKGLSSRGLTAVLFVLLSSAGLNAAEGSETELWDQANAAYEQGDWATAVEAYEEISNLGLESPQLYYNIGNAFYRQGELAKSVLYYERALKLDPSFADAGFNLEHVNGILQDKIEVIPEFFLKEWMRDLSRTMSSDAWAVTFLCMLGLTLALILVFALSSSVVWRRVGFFAGLVTLVLTFAALSFSSWQKNEYERHDEAVVMKTVTSVKSSPSSDNSTDLFILHEGTKVKVIESSGAWTNVALSDGRQGWMKTTDIEII